MLFVRPNRHVAENCTIIMNVSKSVSCLLVCLQAKKKMSEAGKS